MMDSKLTQSEFEDLSAFLDGELAEEASREIARRVESDAAWASAHSELLALDRLLDAYTAPAVDERLAERICRPYRRASQRVLRSAGGLWRRLVPLSAAAAVVIGLGILGVREYVSRDGGPVEPPSVAANDVEPPDAGPDDSDDAMDEVDRGLKDYSRAEQFAIVNLPMVRTVSDEYDVIANFETLQAIEQLERQQEGS
jgi:hypothetical protein